jgi:tRNA(fMet)-specific endonuclease VapC
VRYLLDTCTVSDFLKGFPNVLRRMTQTGPELLAVSIVTRLEIDYGLALNPERAEKYAPLLDDFFSVVPALEFGLADAQASAALRASLRRQGRPIGAYDVLIAGTALARGLTVVTSNTGEFDRIAGLRVENWR